MCGRYTVSKKVQLIKERFLVDQLLGDIHLPRYNIAPTQDAPVVIFQDNKRVLTSFQWGLVPFWLKESPSKRIINARGETINEKKMYKGMLKRGRCLVVADSFFEWVDKKEDRVPLRILLQSEDSFAFAGVYTSWTNPEDKKINTFAIVTRDSEGHSVMNPIHHRMPIILKKEDEEKWLNSPLAPESLVKDILYQYPSNQMKTYEVSKVVNSPKNDDSRCIQPVS